MHQVLSWQSTTKQARDVSLHITQSSFTVLMLTHNTVPQSHIAYHPNQNRNISQNCGHAQEPPIKRVRVHTAHTHIHPSMSIKPNKTNRTWIYDPQITNQITHVITSTVVFKQIRVSFSNYQSQTTNNILIYRLKFASSAFQTNNKKQNKATNTHTTLDTLDSQQ